MFAVKPWCLSIAVEACRRAGRHAGLRKVETVMVKLARWSVEKPTGRAAMGLKLLAALLLFVAYLDLHERADTAQLAAREMQTRALALAEIEQRTGWLELQGQARTVADAWSGSVWQASTPGVAAAQVQGRIQALLEGKAKGRANVRVLPDPIELDQQTVLRFDVNARMPLLDAMEFTAALGLHSPRLVVTALHLTVQTHRTFVNLSGYAPLRVQQGETVADAS